MLKILVLLDNLLILFCIFSGRFLVIFGGWFEFTLICKWFLLRLLQFSWVPIFKFNVTSKTLTIFRFVSLVMRSLNYVLDTEMNTFRIHSARDLWIFPKHAKPSSRHKPILSYLYFSPKSWRIYRPISSQISTPLLLPLVKSKLGLLSFFIQILLANSKDFLESFITLIYSLLILTNVEV